MRDLHARPILLRGALLLALLLTCPGTWAGSDADTAADVERLRERALLLPVQGLEPEKLRNSFKDKRGRRSHLAIDIMAPRRTPVLAADDGRVEKLQRSRSGGITIYQFDPEREYTFMYAHLDAYAKGLREGQEVHRGDVIGYVGSTGNAKKRSPHLHFAIRRLDETKRWWIGTPVDPYPIWVTPS